MAEPSSTSEGSDAPPDAARCVLRLVGRPRCMNMLSGAWVDLPAKGAALLLLLVVERSLYRARLLGLLWPGSDEDKARGSLRGLLRDLRRCAGVPLVSGAETLELSADVSHDMRALDGQITTLADAPAGEPLAGLDYTRLDEFLEWLLETRARWSSCRQRALHRLAHQVAGSARHEHAAAVTERLLAEDPTDEAACDLHMRLLYRSGRAVAALAAFARCREALQRERGSEPSQVLAGLVTLIELGQPVPVRTVAMLSGGPVAPRHLVARERELEAVRRAWGAGQGVWLEGEPGIGKTRLVAELVASEPARVMIAALIGDVDVPFATLNRLLRALLARGKPPCAPEASAELGRFVAELGPRPRHPAHPGMLVQALAAALVAWRTQGVTAILVDDAQWADAASMSVLMPALDQSPSVSVLLAARPGQRHGLIDAAPARWAVILPRPLDEQAVAALLLAMPVPVTDVPAWAAVLAARTLGSPLHVIETVLALRSSLGEHALREAPPTDAELPVPARIDELVQARLARLPAPARHLAQLVALAGGLFSVALARSVLGRNELELADLWLELEAGQVLKDGSLTHDTLRGALEASLPAAVAQELHARIAEHGQAHGAADAELAFHWRHAQAWAAAAACYERAAQQARALNARVDETRLWDEAVACQLRLGERGRAQQARCAAGEAALTALPAAQAKARAQALMETAEDDDARLSALLVAARTAFVCHELEALAALGLQATALARNLRDAGRLTDSDDRLLQATCAYARGLAFTGDVARAIDELAGVHVAATGMPQPRAELDYQDAVGAAMGIAGRFDEATRAYLRCERIARDLDDVAEIQVQLTNVCVCHSRAGRYGLALQAAEESCALMRRLGESRGVQGGVVQMLVGVLSARMGRYADSLEALEEAMSVFRKGQAAAWLADTETHAAGVWMDLGRLEDAWRAMQSEPAAPDNRLLRAAMQLRLRQAAGSASLEEAKALVDGFQNARMDSRLATMLLLAREQPAQEALATAREVLGRSTPLGLHGLAQHARLVEVDSLRRIGHTDEAAALASALLPGLDACRPANLYFADAFLILAQALAAAQQHDRAAEVIRLGRIWVLDEALPHVPHRFKRDFQIGNVVNRRLFEAPASTMSV
jgi:DNA-binding SARP family transcriptional activator